MGALDPLSAAEIAKLYGVRVYTIGVGSLGTAPYLFKLFGKNNQDMEVQIDEALLKEVAQLTDGRYLEQPVIKNFVKFMVRLTNSKNQK